MTEGHYFSSKQSVRIAIDIGGTFTDLVLVDLPTGQVRIEKVASTPADPSIGLIRTLESAHAGSDIELIIHGTTVATNAILER